MSIVNDAMVANLSIGVWQGYRLNKELSRKVTEDADADPDAARVNMHLIPKETLRYINAAASMVRTHFYGKTLPWKDNGDRLLTRRLYMPFIEEHAALNVQFDTAVESFLTVGYPAACEQAEFRMGAMFSLEEYPPPEALAPKFYAHLDIDAVTEGKDFRVELEADQLESVRGQIEQAMANRINGAMGEVWRRLGTALSHFAEKMDGDAIFRDTTVTHLEEIVALLPDMNILGDPALEQIHQDLRQSVLGLTPKDLRKNPAARQGVAAEAKRIMAGMSGFMKAFEVAP